MTISTILWLVFTAFVVWGLFNFSRVVCFFLDLSQPKEAELAKPKEPSKLKQEPDYLPKNRTYEAAERREWDYAFAALQIKASQNKGNK